MPTPQHQPLLSAPDVAALLAVHQDTVRELIYSRRIAAIFERTAIEPGQFSKQSRP